MKATPLALAALALGLAACAPASNSPARSQGQTITVTPQVIAELERRGLDPNEEVCRRTEEIGSTIPRNVCATRAVWEAQRIAARQATEEAQRRGLVGTTQPAAGGGG